VLEKQPPKGAGQVREKASGVESFEKPNTSNHQVTFSFCKLASPVIVK
jgi:hypothetical protein